MDWTEILINLGGLVLGGGLGALFTLKSTRKKAEFEVWEKQLDQALEEVTYERNRNRELDAQHKKDIDYMREENAALMDRNKYLVERMTDKENRFQEQTLVVRQHVAEVIELTKQKGELETERVRIRCEDQECPFRMPPNAHTPAPPGISREEWHKRRETHKKENPDG